eukprot:49767-Eustigmatos_ZCMA.PRE.1
MKGECVAVPESEANSEPHVEVEVRLLLCREVCVGCGYDETTTTLAGAAAEPESSRIHSCLCR